MDGNEMKEKLDALVEMGLATVEVVDGDLVYSSTEKGRLMREYLVNTDPESAQLDKLFKEMEDDLVVH